MTADRATSEGRQDGPEAPAQRARRPAAALPCLNGNNSIQSGQVPASKAYRLKRKKNVLTMGGQVVAIAGPDVVKDSGGRMALGYFVSEAGADDLPVEGLILPVEAGFGLEGVQGDGGRDDLLH